MIGASMIKNDFSLYDRLSPACDGTNPAVCATSLILIPRGWSTAIKWLDYDWSLLRHLLACRARTLETLEHYGFKSKKAV